MAGTASRWASGAICVVALALTAALPSGAAAAGSECANATASPDSIPIRTYSVAVECLINERRERLGVRTLRANDDLRGMGARHAAKMAQHNCWAHECPGEPSFENRLEQSGYLDGKAVKYSFAENWGHGTTPRDMVAYMFSVRNFRVFLSAAKFRDIGVGCAHGDGYPGNPDKGRATCAAEVGVRG